MQPLSSSTSTSDDENGRPYRLFALAVIALSSIPWLLGVRAELPLSGYVSPSGPWMFEMEKRVRAQALSIDKPKVVMVGASDLIFGIHAGEFSRELGIPVVNYGTHGGVGLDLTAARAASVIKPGDTVVLMAGVLFLEPDPPVLPERLDWLAKFPEQTSQDTGVLDRFWSYELARYRSILLKAAFQDKIFKYVSNKPPFKKRWAPVKEAGPGPSSVYDVLAIGENGELSYPRPASIAPISGNYWKPASADEADLKGSRAARALEILRNASQAAGARLLVVPGIRVANPGKNDEVLNEIERRWLKSVEASGVRVLLPPGSTILGPENRYDMEFHLNDPGAAIIQERLLKALNTSM